jgi:hypothetical protein
MVGVASGALSAAEADGILGDFVRTARRPNTATESFSAARGLVAFQSSC